MSKLKRLSARKADRSPIQISVIIVIICIVSGFYGWTAADYHWVESLYRALLALGASDIYTEMLRACPSVEQGSKCPEIKISGYPLVALNVARYAGLLFLFGAVLYAAANLLSRTVAQFRADLGGRRLVCIGQGDLIQEAFQSDAAAGMNRVWLGAPSALNLFRSVAVPWSVTQPVEQSIGKAIRGAKQILVCGENDTTTLKYLNAVSKYVEDGKDKPVSITAFFAKDGATEPSLRRTNPSFVNDCSSLRCLTYSKLTSREVIKSHPPFVLADQLEQRSIHVLIVGFGRVGQTLLKDIAVNCATAQMGKPYITVLDPEMAHKRVWIDSAIPELDQICHFTVIDGGLSDDFAHPGALPENLPDLTAVYICVGDGNLAIGALGGLRVWLRKQGKQVENVFIRTNSINFDGQKDGAGSEILRSFGTFDAVLNESQFLSNDPDALARRYHEEYNVHTLRQNPDEEVKSWLELAEPFKASNRALVDHFQAKKFSAKLDVDTSLNDDGQVKLGTNEVLFDSAEELEVLAALEHNRFMAERRADGWSTGPRNNEMRTDPNFVDYDELTEETKSFDRLIVNLTKTLLRDG